MRSKIPGTDLASPSSLPAPHPTHGALDEALVCACPTVRASASSAAAPARAPVPPPIPTCTPIPTGSEAHGADAPLHRGCAGNTAARRVQGK